ncbi:MAG: translation initiation factor IF-2 [Candidatus Sumerlaeia bacterium]|nr:translation initiation factor IF-2 [Candidatus Sumerlaeia bacterium]
MEAKREAFAAKGFKINKKLTASSGLEPEVAAEVVATLDRSRQAAIDSEKKASDAVKHEEAEKRRAEDARKRAERDVDERRKAEERRKQADQELAKRTEELAKIASQRVAPPPPVAPPPVAPPPAATAPAGAPPRPQQPRPQSPPMNRGDRPQGDRPQGDRPYQPRGDRPQGDRPQGDRPYTPRTGDRPQGDRPYQPRGDRPQGDRPQGDRPFQPRGDRPQGDRPQGDRPYQPRGDRPQGDRPYPLRTGDRPQGDRPYQPRGDRPQGDRPYPPRTGDRPQGDRPYTPRTGDRPQGDRPYPPRAPGDRGGYQGRGPGGPGGDRGGPRPGGPGGRPGDPRGPRPMGGGPGGFAARGGAVDTTTPETEVDNRPKRGDPRGKKKDRDSSIKDFVAQGFGTDLKNKSADPRARKGPVKAAAPAARRRDDDPKRIRPTELFHLSDGIEQRQRGRRPTGGRKGPGGASVANEPETRKVTLTGDFTVSDFAAKIDVPASEVIKKLFLMGEALTMNQMLNPDLAELIASEFDIEVSVEREGDEFDIEEFQEEEDESKLVHRAPVVTIMGHVDHGKTTLLDRIRKANVAAKEAGGMTQHIGAYKVDTTKGPIVFLDTPGHEAFTAMRARGAKVTDLVVLVVAANDGVMPQTIEAINHAKAAGVPIIVAVNKVDQNGADPMRVKQELMSHQLVAEDFGGETIMAHVSGLTGQGVDELLELIALQAEVLELKANPDRPAEGSIVESRIDPLRGAVATVLIQRGTLRIGDVFLCGVETGRIRAMRDDKGKALEEAGPSTPVEILGISGSPAAGEHFIVLDDEGTARDIADRRQHRRRSRGTVAREHVTLENLAQHIAEGETKTLNIIVKADVQGSVEAIRGALEKIKSNKVMIRVLHSAVGGVGSSDVSLADASDAIVIAFNVRADGEAMSLAERLGVSIRHYDIIFNVIGDVEKAMVGMLAPVIEEKVEGRMQILQTFRASKIGMIAGGVVQSGTVSRNHKVRLIRDSVIVYTGSVASLRRVKDDVKSVETGVECGIVLERFNDVKVGDVIETYSISSREATLAENR